MPESAQDLKDVTIRIDKSSGADMDQIVTQLRALGLEHVQVLSRLLVVNGRIQAASIPGLRQVKGVSSVRESGVFRAV
jgi:hypothetical protein